MVVVSNNCVFSLYRPKGGDFAEISAKISAFIEPASAEIIAMYDDWAPWGALFHMFSDCMNVEIGDKIVIDNENYFVRGVKKFDSFIWQHAEIIVRKSL